MPSETPSEEPQEPETQEPKIPETPEEKEARRQSDAELMRKLLGDQKTREESDLPEQKRDRERRTPKKKKP